MNIQIFGTKKCNETKKAERFFKERGIKYQFVDMKKGPEQRRIQFSSSGKWWFRSYDQLGRQRSELACTDQIYCQ